VILRKHKIVDMKIEAHTGKPPYSAIPSDHIVVGRILNGERPRWPLAPAQGYDVSAGVKELSESCWNSHPAQRPTAQAIVEALSHEVSQDDIQPQICQSSPITSNINVPTLQEASQEVSSIPHDTIMGGFVSATTTAGHIVEDESKTSELSKRFT
jgi:hypothetical protein